MLATLLQAIREGDRAAFDLALDPERLWLLDRACQLVDGPLRRFVDPEDLVQDVLLLAYRKLSSTRLQQQRSLRGWLDQVLTRLAQDERRRHLRQRRRDLDTLSLDEAHGHSSTGTTLNLGACLAASEPSPSIEAANHEGFARLHKVLALLPEDQRAAVRLLRLEGRPIAEVAVQLQRSAEAVEKLFYRALDAVREHLLGTRDPRPRGGG